MNRLQKLAGIALLFGLSLCMNASVALAQQGAVRQACAADYQSLCSGVQPGGGRILACLRENAAKLSPACKTAIASAKGAK